MNKDQLREEWYKEVSENSNIGLWRRDIADYWLEKMAEQEKAMVEVYDEYINLLEKEASGLYGLAHVHGWKAKDEDIEKGKELRLKIKALKEQ